MKSKIRREITWLCLPLVLIIVAGAWISHAQSERNARQRVRDSGPSRVRIWSIQTMPGDAKMGYRYVMRVDAHIEGTPLALPPGKVWGLQARSARISSSETSQKARIVNDVSPVDGDKVTRTDVWAIIEPTTDPHEVAMWIYCDSALNRPILNIQLEAVQGIMTPRPGKTYLKRFATLGPQLVAPIEKIPLRLWNPNDDKLNIIKSES